MKLCLPKRYGTSGSGGTFKIIFPSILSKNHAPFLRNWSSSDTRPANDNREHAALSSVGDFTFSAEQNNRVVFSIFCAVFQSFWAESMSKTWKNVRLKYRSRLSNLKFDRRLETFLRAPCWLKAAALSNSFVKKAFSSRASFKV